MKIKQLIAAALLAGTVLDATPAAAAITINSISGDPGFLNGRLTYTDPNPDRVIDVGVGRIKLSGYDGVPANPVTYLAYCIDILNWLTNGTFNIEPVANVLDDEAKRDTLLRLLSNADPLIALEGNATAKKDISAGIQLAVWEIVYENTAAYSYDLTNGVFSATGVSTAAFDNAADYLALSVEGGGWSERPGYSLNVLEAAVPSANQNQLFLVFTPVPEPATWAMMIAGFGIVGGALRLRSRKPALA